MIAGTLEIQLFANIARLQQDMDAAKRTGEQASRAMESAADIAKSALLGLGAAFSADAMIEKMHSAIETLADLEDAAKKTGTSVAEISKAQQITVAFGGDFQQVQVGIARMSAQMADSSSAASHALEALGIKSRDATGQLRSGGAVLDDVSRKLAEYQDGAGKVALVTDLMGKNGAQMLPFLADYAEHIDEVTGVSADAAAQAKAFEDQIGGLKLQSATFTQHLASEAIPHLEDYIAVLNSIRTATGDTTAQTSALGVAMDGIGTVFEALVVFGRNVAYVFQQVGAEIGAVAAQGEAMSRAAADLLKGDLSAAKADWQQAMAIHADAVKQAQAARAALDAADQRTLTARQTAQDIRAGQGMTDPRIAAQLGSQTQAVLNYIPKAGDTAAAALKKVQEQFDALVAKIQGKSAGLDPDFFKNMQLLADQGKKAGLSLQQIIDLQGQYIKQQPFAIAQEKAKKDAIEAAAKANTAAVDAQIAEWQKAYDANEQQIKGAREYSDDLAFQTSLIGKTKEQVDQLTLAHDLEKKGIVAGTQAYDAYIKTLQDQVAVRDALQAQQDQIDAIRKYWEQTAQDINRSLTDALMQSFENGKGFAQSFRDAIKSLFSTLILRPVVQMVMSPVSSGIAGIFGGPTAASAASLTGNSSALNWLNSGSSLYSNIATDGGLIGSIAGSSAAYSAAIGGGSMAAGSQAAMLASQTGVFGSAGLSATAAAAGGAGSAAIGALAAAAPYLAAAVALYAIVSGMQGGETRQGGQYGIGDILRNNHGVGTPQDLSSLSLLSNPSGGEIAGDAVRTSITQTVDGINQLLKATGSQAVVQGFQAGLESSGEGRGGVYAGGTLSTGATFGLSGLGDNYTGTLYDKAFSTSPDSQTALANFSTELLQTTVQALQAATDIPKFIQDQLQGVDAKKLTTDTATALITSIQQQVDSINAFNKAMSALPFEGLKNMSLDAAAALGQAVGGIANLANMASSLQNFANNTAFYSQAEIDQRDKANLQKLFDSYGVAMPTTTAGYRALVDEATQLASTSATAAQGLQDLLNNADTFARVVGSTSSALAQGAGALSSAYASAANADYLTPASQASAWDRNTMLGAAYGPIEDANTAYWNKVNATTQAGNAIIHAIFGDTPVVQGTPGGVGGSSATSSALSAWQSATDAIVSTMKDLRTTLLGTGSQSLVQLQAQFAIATAQAKAGDLTAAQNLPQLAKDLVAAGQNWSATATDQARLTSGVLASLSQVLGARGVAVPQFAGGGLADGWAIVGEQGPELVNFSAPARVYTASQTSAALGGGSGDLSALRAEVAALRTENGAENRAAVALLSRINLILTRASQNPDALSVRVLT